MANKMREMSGEQLDEIALDMVKAHVLEAGAVLSESEIRLVRIGISVGSMVAFKSMAGD